MTIIELDFSFLMNFFTVNCVGRCAGAAEQLTKKAMMIVSYNKCFDIDYLDVGVT